MTACEGCGCPLADGHRFCCPTCELLACAERINNIIDKAEATRNLTNPEGSNT